MQLDCIVIQLMLFHLIFLLLYDGLEIACLMLKKEKREQRINNTHKYLDPMICNLFLKNPYGQHISMYDKKN